MKYEIMWNAIELFFTKQMEWQRCIEIDIDFDSSSEVRVKTHGITEILHYEDDEWLRVAQHIIFNDIIIRIKETSKTEKLDFMQLLKINWHTCMLIDHWNYICILWSEEK